MPIKDFSFHNLSIRLPVPDEALVQGWHAAQKRINPTSPFPYWAKAWPAAIALSNYLAANPQLIKGKTVLELAAGLGLPSLVAAQFAAHVLCTDYHRDAVQYIKQAISINGLKNMEAGIVDWNHLPQNLHSDVLLLSDVAYDPAAFETLLIRIQLFLQKGSTILLSMPQRLMSKPFAARLLPFCIQVHTEDIEDALISIFILKTTND